MQIKGVATDNLPNRNGGRFGVEELARVAALMPGIPITFDHSDRYADKRGRITEARLISSEPPAEMNNEQRKVVEREGYYAVEFVGEIDGIEAQSEDGVSISALYRREECPDCDCDQRNWQTCPRPITEIMAKGWVERKGVEDVLELSLVLIPAVKGAKVLSERDSVNLEGNLRSDAVVNPSREEGKVMKSQDVVTGETPLMEKEEVKKAIAMDAANPIAEEETEIEVPQKTEAPQDKAPQVQKDGLTLSAEELHTLQEMQIARDMKVAELEGQLREAIAALDSTKKEAEAARREAAEQKVKASIGISMPGVNILSGASTPDKLLSQGCLGEWHQIWDNAPSKDVSFDNHTMVRRQRHSTDSFRFWLKHRDALRPEVEKLAKASGFLQGSFDAATAKSDIPTMLLEYLSNMMRITHQSRKIFWQFPVQVEDFNRGPGDTVRIPRWAFLPEPTATADFTLVPGTALSTSPQNLSALDRSFVLQEIGSGKSGVSGMAPVGIPEFWIARSIQDLEMKTVSLLGQNYEAAMDLWIRSQYQTATTILYNDNGAVTETPADVGTGDDGRLTQDFLHAVYSRMSADNVLPLPDGQYVAALNTYSAAQLRKSLGDQLRITTAADVASITNLLPQSAEQGQISGYLGSYCNFHVFETNVYGVGAAGTEGAQNVTLGTGSTLTRSSWVFGAAAVGQGVGMQPQIFRNTNDDYGRMSMWVWRAHMAVGTLDVDPNNDASEQIRVYEIRCTDVAQ